MAPRRRDLVHIEPLDLDQRFLILHLRRGTGYGDVHILELPRQRIGPAILLAFDRRQLPAARALPPRPRLLPPRRPHGALHSPGPIMPGTTRRHEERRTGEDGKGMA